MKKRYGIIGVLVVLSVLLTLDMMIAAPEEIPAHFNGVGQVTRMGSQYELLILPVLSYVVAGVFVVCQQIQRKKGGTQRVQKYLLGGAIYSLILLNFIGFSFGMEAVVLYGR